MPNHSSHPASHGDRARTPHLFLQPATVLSLVAVLAISAAHAQTQQRISGEDFVDFGKDATGLTHYTRNGTMCVVHRPDCSGAADGIFSVGHNGKDHFFPAEMPLPKGVTLVGVQYKVYWPNGIDHTDRGGVGSKGSYGAKATQQTKAPLYSVHWENACQASTSADWSKLPVTYQVSFVINVPKGTIVNSAVAAQPASADVCNQADIPSANPTPAATTGPGGVSGSYFFNCTLIDGCSADVTFLGKTTATQGAGLATFSKTVHSGLLTGPSSVGFSQSDLRPGPWQIVASPSGVCPDCGQVLCPLTIPPGTSPLLRFNNTTSLGTNACN